MENLIRDAQDAQEINDNIHEKLTKARAILGCLMSIDVPNLHENISAYNFYNALWTVDDFLKEIELLLTGIMTPRVNMTTEQNTCS
ncbi:MAG: hypothetical protein HWD59_09645 [Coxiellaceae bacterium]|nr:MAG: hypothetical protein HWD59_09645 [Coxiellaceae bacterium]